MAKKKNQQKLSQAVRNVGPVMSRSEAQQVAKATGKSVAQVTTKATKAGVGLGSALVNQISKSPTAPAPLQNLTLNKGQAYYGSSTTTTPSSQTRTRNGGMSYTPGSTTYNPIVLPRGTGAGGAGGNKNGGGKGKANDPYQDLRDQIDAAQQTINDLQNQPVDPYAGITSVLAAQQQTMAEQAQMQQQYLQELMIQQQTNFDTQMQFAQTQQDAMAAQAAEAQRQATAVANAYIPGLEPSAASPTLGDARDTSRSSAVNTLSNLSILTGMGVSGGVTATPAAASPLAGLQIA